ncbi:MAG: Hpt domain-containing protein [Gammaproteobacteria bacterium]|nr:Hpt domain-containing protein [Gammaproteobacteria bacterium]
MNATEKNIIIIDSDLEDLIPGFLENRGKDVLTLKKACEDNDAETLRSVGHSLKGVGGGYGFDEMSRIGAEIELLAKSSDVDGVGPLIKQLEDYMENIEIKYE